MDDTRHPNRTLRPASIRFAGESVQLMLLQPGLAPGSTPARFTGRRFVAGGLHPPAIPRRRGVRLSRTAAQPRPPGCAAAPRQRGLAGDEHRPRSTSMSCGTPPGDQSPGYAAAPRQRGLVPDRTPARFTGRRVVAGGLHPPAIRRRRGGCISNGGRVGHRAIEASS